MKARFSIALALLAVFSASAPLQAKPSFWKKDKAAPAATQSVPPGIADPGPAAKPVPPGQVNSTVKKHSGWVKGKHWGWLKKGKTR